MLNINIKETKQMLTLSIPMMISQVTRLLVMFVATFFVATLGNDSLAGMALGYNYYLCVFLFCNGLFFSNGVLIGRFFGAKQLDEIPKTLSSAFLLSIISSIPAIIILHLGHFVFSAFHQNPAVALLAQHLLDGLSWGIIPLFLSMNMLQFLLSTGHPKILNLFSIISLFIGVILFELLIFGHYGFPRLGLAGVGYGMGIASWFNLLMMIAYCSYKKDVRALKPFSQWRTPDLTRLKQLFNIGWPIGLTMVLEIIAGTVAILFIGILSVPALAAYQIAWQIYLIVLMVPIAISQAMSIITSQQIGQEKMHRIRDFLKTALILCLGITFCFSLFLWFFPHAIAGIFLHREQHVLNLTAHYAALMIIISGFSLLFEAVRFSMTGALRGMHDVKMPLLISIISFWAIGIPIEAIVAFVFKLGPMALYFSAMVGLMINAVWLTRRFQEKTADFKS